MKIRITINSKKLKKKFRKSVRKKTFAPSSSVVGRPIARSYLKFAITVRTPIILK